jgi:(p)ppGpp synthase/HD superfamily hydrolase
MAERAIQIAAEAERKAELINQSEDLVRLFGFARGKKASIKEIEEKLADNTGRVKEALLLIYEQQNPFAAAVLASCKEVQLAFLLNLQKMVEFGRVRQNGDPYYVHPQSVSQKIIGYLPAEKNLLQAGVIGSLLHDYLEEGAGVSPASVGELKSAFAAFNPQMAADLALLTEPNYIENGKKEKPELPQAINYDNLTARFGKNRRTFETIIFCIMMRNSELMQMVVPVDKLDNLEDCEKIQKFKASKKSATAEEYNKNYLANVAKTLAAYLFYAENCRFPESLASSRALAEKTRRKISSLQHSDPALAGLDGAVKARLDEYRAILGNKEIHAVLSAEIKDYYRALGLDEL